MYRNGIMAYGRTSYNRLSFWGGIMDNILFMWSCYTIIALKVVSWIIKYYKNEVTYGKVVCM